MTKSRFICLITVLATGCLVWGTRLDSPWAALFLIVPALWMGIITSIVLGLKEERDFHAQRTRRSTHW